MFKLSSKTAIIAGGTGGIGKAVAIDMAKQGANIVIADINVENVEDIKKAVEESGSKMLAVQFDITSEESVNSMVKEAVKQFPKIHILVNAAGIVVRKSSMDISLEEWQKVLNINTTGTFLTSRAVAREMKKNNYGRIINLSSVRGEYGSTKGVANYGASKGAVNAMTKALAGEWASSNITVNAVAPSVIETEFVKKLFENPKKMEKMKNSVPLGRWGQTKDVSGPILFLASDAASFVTGHILYVDGGLTSIT